MRDLAVFTQLTDDWVDAETDMDMRETPVLTGARRPRARSRRGGQQLLADSGSMLRACGISEPRIAELVEDGVRYVLWSGIEGMDRRIAD